MKSNPSKNLFKSPQEKRSQASWHFWQICVEISPDVAGDACLGGRALITKTGGKPHYGGSNTSVSNTLVLVL